MSTVTQVLAGLSKRIDTSQSVVLDLLNVAIRGVAKALYVRGSDLARTEMSLGVYATTSVQDSGISFSNSGGNYIYHSGGGFSGFHAGTYVLTGNSTYPGPYKIVTVASGYLLLRTTDSVGSVAAASLAVASIDEYVDLPSTFWGFADKPNLASQRVPLDPLPGRITALQLDSAGLPKYYKVKALQLFLYPPPSSDDSVVADIFSPPTELTATTDTMPWYGLFDDILAELIVQLYNRNAVTETEQYGILTKEMREDIDLVLAKFDRRHPDSLPVGINWEAM